MAQQKGMVHVTGAKDLVEALSHLSTRTGSILATAIRDALRPVVGPMRQQVLRVVKNDNKSSKHWSVSETDYKTRVKKNGKTVRTRSSAELIRAVQADPKYLGKKKFRQNFAKEGSLQEAGDTGMLAKSISVKAKAKRARITGSIGGKTIRQSQKAAKGWLGPADDEMVGLSRWLRKPIVIRATRYAHLVNGGHRVVIRKKMVGRVQATPFLEPVLASHQMGIASRVEERLRFEISKALAGKGKR